MKTFLLSLALSATLAGAALAQATIADPTKAQPGAYALEPEHTRVLFSVSHLGFTTYYGEFNGASGKLEANPRAPAQSRVNVSIPVASVSTPSAKLTDELKSADWLDAGKYPTITFTSTRATMTGKDRGTLSGTLTLHGVTKPVTLQVKFNGAGSNPLDKKYTVGFEASGHIRRSDFGVKKYVPLVGDDVQLIISAAFERAG